MPTALPARRSTIAWNSGSSLGAGLAPRRIVFRRRERPVGHVGPHPPARVAAIGVAQRRGVAPLGRAARCGSSRPSIAVRGGRGGGPAGHGLADRLAELVGPAHGALTVQGKLERRLRRWPDGPRPGRREDVALVQDRVAPSPAARWTSPTGLVSLPPPGPGDAGHGHREVAAGVGQGAAAISRAVASLTAPWSAASPLARRASPPWPGCRRRHSRGRRRPMSRRSRSGSRRSGRRCRIGGGQPQARALAGRKQGRAARRSHRRKQGHAIPPAPR